MSFNDTEDFSYRTVYDPPPAASRMAGVRFGNTQDVVVLFDGDSDEVAEYIRGLIFIGAITFVVFMTWALLICIFMCLGKEKVGFLSGRPFEREPPQNVRQDDEVAENAQGEKQRRKEMYKRGDPWCSEPSRIRLVFLFSGVVVITFSILLVTRGLTELQTTVDTVNASAKTMQRITQDARDIIEEGLRSLKNRASNVRATLINELDRDIFCPEDSSMENSDVGKEIRKHVDSAVDLLGQLEDFQDKNLNDFSESLLSVQNAAKNVEDTSDNTDFLGWKSMILLIPYTVITALLMSATVMAFFDVSFVGLNRLINWFLLPAFIVMTVGACVLASLTAFAAGVNSDFCLPNGDEQASPDENVVKIMLAEGYVEDEFELRMIEFFVNQCSTFGTDEDPFQPLRTYLPDMRDNQAALNEVIKTLRSDDQLAELSLYCNREFNALDAQLDNMNIILSVLVDSLEKLLDLISCERIVPIYTDTIYDASCEYSTKALFWIFMCAIILGTFGFVMITFRASFKLTVDEDGAPPIPLNKSPQKDVSEEPGPSGHGTRESPVQATPYRTEADSPPEVIRVDENADEVYTAYTGHYTNESIPSPRTYNRRNHRPQDDDTVTREKKANAVDVD